MGPVLNGLIKLQSVENRLRAVKSKLARCRRTVIFQENQLRSLQNGLEAKKEEIKMTRVQVDRCGGCFMGIPAEIVNRLMTNDEVIRCSNCTRILILKESKE